MYCKHCGAELNEKQAICIKCGVLVGKGNLYCDNCGNALLENADFCLNCGVAVKKQQPQPTSDFMSGTLGGQDKWVVAIICIFLGGIGIHNFMMGEQKKGIMKIVFAFICGISGILALIDLIKILLDKYEVDPQKHF